ncbi:MAG: hypothetical protein RLZZ561_704 [Pseudomonadota bacterium]|jgi:outer membrane receptor protein involved in Fe transport
MKYQRLIRLVVGASSLAMAASPALAQSATTAPPSGEEATEIVVTANRRQESIQKVSLSITAVTGDMLKEAGITDYESLVRSVPGVVSTGGSNISKMTMRGIETSQTTSSVGAQRSVSIYIDDLPLTTFSVVTPDITPYDVERVEVLRGPQGTLFGSGSLAGAVRYITNKPNPGHFEAAIDVDGGIQKGDAYRRRAAGMVNVPLVSDTLALRLVGTYKNEDGYIENVGTGVKNSNSQEDWGVRAALRWDASPDFTATLMGSINKNLGGDVPFYNPALGFRKSSEDEPFAVNSKVKTLNLAMNYDLKFADLTSSTTLAQAPSDWNLLLEAIIPGVPLHLREVVKTKSFVQEVRLVSKPSDSFDWVVGGFYLQQKTNFRDALYLTTAFVDLLQIRGLPTNLAPGSTYSNNIEKKDNEELAAFGEANYHISNALKLTAGVRITDSKFTSKITGEGATAPSFFTALFTALSGYGGSTVAMVPQTAQAFSTGHKIYVSPKFVATWQPDDDQTYYASVSKGFRRGQPNGIAAANGGRSTTVPTDPAIIPISAAGDALWNYEIGVKLRLFDQRVRANFAAYYIDWSNMQIPLVRSSDQFPYVGNIGKARSIGLEGEISARPGQGLDLGVNFQIQNAKVTSLSADQALISGAVLNSKLASPDFKIGAYVKKSWEVSDSSEVFARLDLQHVGSYANGFPNTPGAGTLSPTFATIPSYEKVDASFGWAKDQIGATLYVENLTDSKKVIYINPANFSYNRYGTLRPRVIGLRLSYKY